MPNLIAGSTRCLAAPGTCEAKRAAWGDARAATARPGRWRWFVLCV